MVILEGGSVGVKVMLSELETKAGDLIEDVGDVKGVNGMAMAAMEGELERAMLDVGGGPMVAIKQEGIGGGEGVLDDAGGPAKKDSLEGVHSYVGSGEGGDRLWGVIGLTEVIMGVMTKQQEPK